jgi:hypothetical protein
MNGRKRSIIRKREGGERKEKWNKIKYADRSEDFGKAKGRLKNVAEHTKSIRSMACSILYCVFFFAFLQISYIGALLTGLRKAGELRIVFCVWTVQEGTNRSIPRMKWVLIRSSTISRQQRMHVYFCCTGVRRSWWGAQKEWGESKSVICLPWRLCYHCNYQ